MIFIFKDLKIHPTGFWVPITKNILLCGAALRSAMTIFVSYKFKKISQSNFVILLHRILLGLDQRKVP